MDTIRRALGRLSLLYALIFLAAALLHAGAGPGALRRPPIPPAVIVETLCCAAMLTGAYGALKPRPWAWDGLVYTHAAALGGVLLGVLASAFAPGAQAGTLLVWYHGTVATLLAAGLGAAFYVSRVRR
ncbi:hypothetical protein SMD20_42485 [Nonomuraea sp. LP-02]|uniref:hypothetical protein n=1 Tax=Nonomuraea sp. LP-02 TaxID=3097960 RepID=UPI002E2FA367|nr:hypothetical protein [Nonomuraea sp. LP-02]MED7930951.1 hypothetical protein [Nonomuraea sp. LP-02]